MLMAVRASAYCNLAALLLLGPPAAAQTPPIQPEAATFSVFVRSTLVGFERVELLGDEGGWTIRSRGNLVHPINLQNQLFQIEYDEQWHPRSLSIQGVRRDVPFVLQTTFDTAGATTLMDQAGQQTGLTQPIPADAVVLPEYFFAAYEALEARLADAAIGDELSRCVPPS